MSVSKELGLGRSAWGGGRGGIGGKAQALQNRDERFAALDGGDDLHARAAVRALEQVDLEDVSQELSPSLAAGASKVAVMGMSGGWRRRGLGHHERAQTRVGCEQSVVTNLVSARGRNESNEFFDELERLEDKMRRAVS
jgi:hypothetical protein